MASGDVIPYGQGEDIMPRAAYDDIADFYAALVAESAPDSTSVLGVAWRALLAAVGPVDGLDVCDVACGEGHLARHLASQRARVVGVDVSEEMLAQARAQAAGEEAVTFVRDDAQWLETQPAERFDLVLCNLALMDIPDLRAVYAAVWRVLRRGGRFAFTITHPCFLTPHQEITTDERGRFIGRLVTGYTEGFWQPAKSQGIRGKVGTHPRTLATYLNGLIEAGFSITRLDEPMLPPGEYETLQSQSLAMLPTVLLVAARKS